MIKLIMAVVWLSGHVDHVELTGSKYETLRDCQLHARQLTFTNYTGPRSGATRDFTADDVVVGGGFYCEVMK